MELFLKIVGVAFIAVTAFLLLKPAQPQIGNLLIIAAGAFILLLVSDQIASVVTTAAALGEKAGMEKPLFATLLKIVGVGYLTEYAVSVCNDAGCGSLGKKIEFGGKIVILLSTMPLITEIVALLEGLF